MSDRERVSIKQLEYEKKAVQVFCMMKTGTGPASIPVNDLYESYKKWAWKELGFKSQVCVDGFGRLLPKVYKRKSSKVRGVTARVIIGVSLRD